MVYENLHTHNIKKKIKFFNYIHYHFHTFYHHHSKIKIKNGRILFNISNTHI